MKLNQVALQLYTLRNFCKTAADYAATVKKVRAIGYETVELAGVSADIPLAEVRAIAEGEGLAICAAHAWPDKILNEPEQAAEDMETLGAPFAVYGYPHGIDLANPADVKRLITGLDRAGAVFKKAGKTLCYHNHALEFYLVNGKPLLETIYARTQPAHLQAELDTYWVQTGGGCPVQWCEQLKGRLPLLHMKDYAVDAKGKPYYAEVGHGMLDFKAIVAAAEASGCQWYIVEQDECGENDPFDSVRKSFEYIKAYLVG